VRLKISPETLSSKGFYFFQPFPENQHQHIFFPTYWDSPEILGMTFWDKND